MKVVNTRDIQGDLDLLLLQFFFESSFLSSFLPSFLPSFFLHHRSSFSLFLVTFLDLSLDFLRAASHARTKVHSDPFTLLPRRFNGTFRSTRFDGRPKGRPVGTGSSAPGREVS